jgi:uncharacterized protein YndB with AHSA1/START domain
MATAEKSFVVQATPQKVWAIISELKNWDELTAAYLRFSIQKSRFELVAGSGAGARFKVSVGRKVIQEGAIERWEPPRLIALRTRSMTRGFACSESSLTVAIAPQTALTTRVDLRQELNFTHRYFADLVTLLFPLKSSLKRCVEDMSAHLSEMLERA